MAKFIVDGVYSFGGDQFTEWAKATMLHGSSILLNFYTSLVMQQWFDSVYIEAVDGIVHCKYDHQLIRRNTRNALKRRIIVVRVFVC